MHPRSNLSLLYIKKELAYMAFSARTCSALIAITLVASGCVETLHFKAVDARNGEPLANVHTSWHKWSWNFFRDCPGRDYGETNLPPCQSDGRITVKGVNWGWSRMHTFQFSRRGYSDVSCTYDGFFEAPVSTNTFYSSQKIRFREKKGTVTVPLCPE